MGLQAVYVSVISLSGNVSATSLSGIVDGCRQYMYWLPACQALHRVAGSTCISYQLVRHCMGLQNVHVSVASFLGTVQGCSVATGW